MKMHRKHWTGIAVAVICIGAYLPVHGAAIVVAATKPSTSLELRWFYEGSIADQVDRWFDENPRLGGPLTERDVRNRIDLYLVAEGAGGLGVKLREGRLEVKLRLSAEDFAAPHNGVTGSIEAWSKWVWEYSEALGEQVSMAFADYQVEGQRLAVKKNRRQRLFEVSREGQVTPTSLDKHVESGCMIELTELIVNESDWWTLAFDAFAQSNGSRQILERCVSFVLSDYPIPVPEIADSYSYPAWLGRISGS